MAALFVLYRVSALLARLSNFAQILLFLPLTLSTLGQPAFLTLSLFLTLQSLIHCSLQLIPPLKPWLTFFQVPLHPVLLLLSFNLATPVDGHINHWVELVSWLWGTTLRYSSIIFVVVEGIASLVLVQNWGQEAITLADRGDIVQFGLLVVAAAAYVASATWIYICFSITASSPISAVLLGVAITCLIFLTLIGFITRRTNVIESAGVALYLSYNLWLCGAGEGPEGPGRSWGWKEGNLQWTEGYPPLLPHMLPYLNTLLTLLTSTIPKTLLFSLVYRLTVLHRAGKVLMEITAGPWDDDDSTEMRPSRRFAYALMIYRQTIFVIVYSHLLLLDHSSQVWWRWINIFFTLALWAIELNLTNAEDQVLGKEWKVE
ncbi:hypothetical protein CALCODRAFT_483480 [Calocera cornea HHB12733]|uniref:ICE2-domain-containing protein n=1 Tax=Calocera cornea HHB12733 TaxID=1353952 RepID=A0A165FRX9_9BASI|nr:hypothetical protein CALCODRAFT_483480 [Calocera cornea HHB12733]